MKILIVTVFAVLFLSGCKTTEPTYYYGAYPTAVYSYFKANEVSISQQISSVELVIEQAAGKGKPVAPGVHAHLGMLYFESGNAGMGMSNFEQEKALFPESSVFIDFLIKNVQGEK